jgi:hypothetical protein
MQKLTFIVKPEFCKRQPSTHKIQHLALICLLAILSITLTGLSTSAQEVIEMSEMLSSLKASPDLKSKNEAVQIQSLVHDLHSSVNIREGILSTYSEAPFICVDIDAQSISKISEANPLFGNAELLTIRINTQKDLNLLLNVTNLIGFSKLKYIFLLCSIDCTVEQISKLIKKSDTKIIVFYSVSIPS